MPASISLTAHHNRTSDYILDLFEANGTTVISIAATDVIRIKIGRCRGEVPDLDLDSVGATANGSIVGFTEDTNDVTLRLAQGDLNDMTPGTYCMEILIVDDSESAPDDAIKHAQDGVLHLIGQMAGDIGTS